MKLGARISNRAGIGVFLERAVAHIARMAVLLAAPLGSGAALSAASLPADPAGVVQSLARPASPHWVWVNDFVFPHMVSGKAMLVDGDTGRFLGELNTGFGALRVVPSPDGQV